MNLRTMTAADIPFAMQLKEQNRWNQLEADWRRQLDLEPTGCFVAEVAGQPVGTACACVFDDVAWINMVLVDRAHRGQGIGTALMRHVIATLETRGVAVMRLDATPLGQPIYEKLGFVGEFVLERYEGVLPHTIGAPQGVGSTGEIVPMRLADLASIARFDAAVTKTDRAKLLRRLLDEAPDRAYQWEQEGRLEGFAFCRRGSHAWQIGPLQGSARAGAELVHAMARRLADQRVYLDVPSAHAGAIQCAKSLGLAVQRPFLRMTRGRPLGENLEQFWCAFGPEKG